MFNNLLQDRIQNRMAEGFQHEMEDNIEYNCGECKGWEYGFCDDCPGAIKRIGREVIQ